MVKLTKEFIRTQILKKLKRQKEVERLKKSYQIYKKLFSLAEFIKAKIILFYLSFDGEVETHRMIEKAISLGKKIAVPVIDKSKKIFFPSLISDYEYDLEAGPYGVYQPKPRRRYTLPLGRIDLIIVPGVAFDSKGSRIGRGAGYYDRFLNSLPKRIPTVGLAFDFQILGRSPFVEPHDFPVEKVIFA